jgi:hypothetical protein
MRHEAEAKQGRERDQGEEERLFCHVAEATAFGKPNDPVAVNPENFEPKAGSGRIGGLPIQFFRLS